MLAFSFLPNLLQDGALLIKLLNFLKNRKLNQEKRVSVRDNGKKIANNTFFQITFFFFHCHNSFLVSSLGVFFKNLHQKPTRSIDARVLLPRCGPIFPGDLFGRCSSLVWMKDWVENLVSMVRTARKMADLLKSIVKSEVLLTL